MRVMSLLAATGSVTWDGSAAWFPFCRALVWGSAIIGRCLVSGFSCSVADYEPLGLWALAVSFGVSKPSLDPAVVLVGVALLRASFVWSSRRWQCMIILGGGGCSKYALWWTRRANLRGS